MAKQAIKIPGGFRVGAVVAGIKQSGKPDLGLIVADQPCAAAATFTTNKVVGAAVTISRKHVQSGRAQAIFVNAGNANTCTGRRGHQDALSICRQVGEHVAVRSHDVLICSTGIIGHFLPMAKVETGITAAVGKLQSSPKAFMGFSDAILTTDLCRKVSWRQVTVGGKKVTIFGCAKGSGMIAPNMATMLAFIMTDAAIDPRALRSLFKTATSQTFNKVSVDTHTSTSDTAIILASGHAGNRKLTATGRDTQRFAQAVWAVCDDLARNIAADGEGATCAITIRMKGAASARDAHLALRAIVDSPLVRCAFNGADPNWGRIVSAIGYSGARFDIDKLTCHIAGTKVFGKGRPCPFDAVALHRRMKAKTWEVLVDLHLGCHEDFCYTCDLSREYVAINADYHT